MSRGGREKQLVRDYRHKLERAKTPAERMMYRVLLKAVEEPAGEILDTLNDKNAILSFRHTFLSNFYEVAIVYDGITYASVEHAYQAQKFSTDILANVTHEHVGAITRALRERGAAGTFEAGTGLFRGSQLSAGDVKVAADLLGSFGYVRDGWEDNKIRLMIDLLQVKFRNREMRKRLATTGGKYLMEGNSWDDTFWGVCEGRGLNLLGLLLMEFRDQIAKQGGK